MPVWSDKFSGRSNHRLDWLWSTISQDVANNRSRVRRKLSIVRTDAYGSYNFDTSSWSITGGGSRSGTFSYDTRGTSTIVLMEDEIWVTHASDGSLSLTTSASVSAAGVLGSASTGSKTVTSPTIPRASRSTLPGTVTLGSAVTIDTNRASSSFTHTLQLWEYGVNASSPIQTIATGVGAERAWTPALSLASYFPDATSRKFFIRTVTYSGGNEVGRADTVFTLAAPASIRPTVTGINVSDANPTVVSAIGAYVQGQSLLRATVDASGAYGSSITARTFSVDGKSANSGGTLPLPSSGNRTVGAAVTDSRGRTGTATGTVTVLPYDEPQVSNFTVVRADSAGTPDVNGTYLLMTLDASASSLKPASTEKNTLTVTVSTRVRGTSSWTDRNVITPGLAYDNTVLVAGGGIYLASTAYDVRVKLTDKLQTVQDFWAVSTAGAILDATADKQAFGKMVEASGPASQIQGPARVYGGLDIDGHRVLDTRDFESPSWTSLPLASGSGLSGSAAYRVTGQMAEISFDISGSFAGDTALTQALPAALRPVPGATAIHGIESYVEPVSARSQAAVYIDMGSGILRATGGGLTVSRVRGRSSWTI